MKIAIANDHVSVALKREIMQYLLNKNIHCADYGHNEGERSDYPLYGETVARLVAAGEFDRGILICGTGAGICIAANKVKGIRAVVCSEPYTAKLAREHNDCNILCFGARVVGVELAKMMVDAWLCAQFEGGRHLDRVRMITDIETRN